MENSQKPDPDLEHSRNRRCRVNRHNLPACLSVRLPKFRLRHAHTVARMGNTNRNLVLHHVELWESAASVSTRSTIDIAVRATCPYLLQYSAYS